MLFGTFVRYGSFSVSGRERERERTSSIAKYNKIIMGQVNSTVNPEAYPGVWVMEPKTCDTLGCNVQQFPLDEKPAEMVNVDYALWTEFGERINDLLTGMNKSLKPLWTIGIIVVIACAAMIPVLRYVVGDEEDKGDFVDFGGLGVGLIPWALLVVTFFVLISCQSRILTMNEAIDKEIISTIAEFKPRFVEKGFSPQYRTKWTGLCKPRHATPQRIIVFIPTESKV